MQAAGFYEGFATAARIEQFAYDQYLFGYEPSTALAAFLSANSAFITSNIQQARQLPALDPLRIYWYHVDLVLTQMNAVLSGYQAYRHGGSHCFDR